MPPANPPSGPDASMAGRTGRPRVWLAVLVISILVTLAYANTARVPFVLDDFEAIVRNASIQQLGTFDWVRPPATGGETVSGRPVLNLSLALNYAAGGLAVEGYHLVNLGIHLAATLLLFGLVNRTLVGPAAHDLRPGRAGPSGGLVASALIALTWALHPLQTAAVTYVAQRAESLAATFILLTLYTFARSLTAGNPRHTRRWQAGSVIACAMGMATKETAVVTPLLVLLYDRTFAGGSFRAAWTRRRGYHLATAATALLLVALVLGSAGRGESAGFDSAVGPLEYAWTQAAAITRYLGLIVWPLSQVFDYGAGVVTGPGAVVPQLLLLAALLASTAWALRRRPKAGFIGAWFFLTLAPSSSVVPVATQTIAEHRMYLALAAPLAAFWWLLVRHLRVSTVLALGGVLVLLLGSLTVARNRVYGDPVALWRQTTERRPENARAWNNLGLALHQAGRTRDAVAAYRRALELNPAHAFAHANLGALLAAEGNGSAAEPHLRHALALDPANLDARVNLGDTLAQAGRIDEALAEYDRALAADPAADDARINRAVLLLRQGRATHAIAELQTVLRRNPSLPAAHYHLGLALERGGRLGAAETSLHEALRLQPDWPDALLAWGNLQARQGRDEGAAEAYRRALHAEPRRAEGWYALGNLAARQEQYADAMDAYEKCLAIDAAHVGARANLANCQLALGQYAAAIAAYEALLRVHPDDTTLRRNLSLARELQARGAPAPR